ncbi:MAG: hypothetical protein RR397_08830 [Odoribacter sp.]
MEKIRKIAANYIYIPGFPLTKNGYVIVENGKVTVVDTGGKIREIAGLEFYGGMIVPDYVKENKDLFCVGAPFLPVLEKLLTEKGMVYKGLAIIEGADLREFIWLSVADIRILH